MIPPVLLTVAQLFLESFVSTIQALIGPQVRLTGDFKAINGVPSLPLICVQSLGTTVSSLLEPNNAVILRSRVGQATITTKDEPCAIPFPVRVSVDCELKYVHV